MRVVYNSSGAPTAALLEDDRNPLADYIVVDNWIPVQG